MRIWLFGRPEKPECTRSGSDIETFEKKTYRITYQDGSEEKVRAYGWKMRDNDTVSLTDSITYGGVGCDAFLKKDPFDTEDFSAHFLARPPEEIPFDGSGKVETWRLEFETKWAWKKYKGKWKEVVDKSSVDIWQVE